MPICRGRLGSPRDLACSCSPSAVIPLPNPGLHGMRLLGAHTGACGNAGSRSVREPQEVTALWRR